MKALAVTQAPAAAGHCLFDTVEIPDLPAPQGHDLLVSIQAVSVNPVDTKLRRATTPGSALRILGFDAAAIVLQTGPDCEGFQPGDKVYYAGDVSRPGSNATQQLVDSRLVAQVPGSVGMAQAAALPLVSLTAWELLFCRMPFQFDGQTGRDRSLLVIGGAGGVGSLAIQLAALAGFQVIATASRPASRQWCLDMGALAVVNHRQPLAPQLAALGMEQVDVILNLADTDAYWEQMGQIIAPQGHVGLIVEPAGVLRIGDPYKAKSVSIHWEFMFTRARFGTADMDAQHRILNRIASLVDAGQLKVPLGQVLGPINADNLARAHQQIETGSSVGKLVLAGWD